MKRLVCLFRGHEMKLQVKIHRRREVGMHRAICLRCGKLLWFTIDE